MKVGELCTRDVVFATRDATPQEIATLMRDHHVGDVVVIEDRDGHRVPVGVVTDRDLVVELIAPAIPLTSVTAADFMSAALVAARETDEAYDAMQQMRAAGVRRLPITDARGHLVGILTLDDALELIGEEIELLIRAMGREQKRERRLRG